MEPRRTFFVDVDDRRYRVAIFERTLRPIAVWRDDRRPGEAMSVLPSGHIGRRAVRAALAQLQGQPE